MSEDHPELSAVEILNTVKNVAQMAWIMFSELKEQGFDTNQAMTLTGKWMAGSAGGKID